MSSPAARHAERLWPGPLGWALVPVAALVGAVVLLPVGPGAAALGAAVGLVAAAIAVVTVATPVVVAGGELRAGSAHIPVADLGEPVVLDRAGVRAALGPGSDARTWACLRAWVRGGVLVPVTDPRDPTPAWLVSSRRPERLASAIVAERQAAHSVQTS